eukprot:scaffold648844_cov52-Prasinocladus_malaysianus.AAC.1
MHTLSCVPGTSRVSNSLGKTQQGTIANGLFALRAASTMASVAWSGCIPTRADARPRRSEFASSHVESKRAHCCAGRHGGSCEG